MLMETIGIADEWWKKSQDMMVRLKNPIQWTFRDVAADRAI